LLNAFCPKDKDWRFRGRLLIPERRQTMQIPVLVEPMENQGFRATGGSGLEFAARGATAEEALGRFRAEIERRIAAGAILVNVEVGAIEENPWTQCVGSLKDDPFFDAWQQEIAENRRELDENPDCQ
jgi:hypothetical protein